MNFVRKNILLISITALIISGSAFLMTSQNRAETPKNTFNLTSEKTEKIKVTIKADSQEKSYQVEAAVGKTALETTKLATSDIETTGEGQSAFITAINGRQADPNKKEFWKLVINNEDAKVGAGSYTVQKGDTISWEIDTY